MAQIIDAPISGKQTQNIDPKDESLLTSFKDMFISVVSTTDKDEGKINSQTRKMLDKGQQETIRQSLAQIDAVLKKECLFCGSFLIDMIDNEIEGGKDSEFAEVKSKKHYGQAAQNQPPTEGDDWEIN